MDFAHITRSSACPRLLAAAALVTSSCVANAVPFELAYSGYFNTNEALNLASGPSLTFFTALTPFTIIARFDDSSPNLAPHSPPAPPPFAGYRAYAPTSMTIDLGTFGHFTVNSIDNPGLTVSIFDQHSFDPGRYAVGIIVNAPADGAGIIGDFSSASPSFVASSLTSTVFGDYNGVGHSSGVCMSGTAPDCDHFVTPLVLRGLENAAWNLTLANYEVNPPDQPLNRASITAVPEPSIFGLMLASTGLLAWGARSRRRSWIGQTSPQTHS